jgi:hypothetical protein
MEDFAIGDTAFTRTPLPARSAAQEYVIDATAPLVALYDPW